MSSLAARLARPDILALASAGGGGDGSDAIRLDANENPYPPLVEGALAAGLNRYPEAEPERLRLTMAALYGTRPASLVVTRGRDDAVDMLVRAFCRPETDAVVIGAPGVPSYARAARLQGARPVAGPGADGAFDADAFVAAVRADPSPKLALLASPNEATGEVTAPAELLRIVEALPETIVVVDESCLEFSEMPSLAGAAAARPNLVVLKTLSRAYGLAGARIGAAIGDPELIAIAARALPPHALPGPSVAAALVALDPSRRPLHEQHIARIKSERRRLAARLGGSPLLAGVRSGGGNFLFLEAKDPESLTGRLAARGIRVCRADVPPGGVRLTVGNEAENDAALAAFDVGAEASAGRRAEVVRDTKETRIAVAVDLEREGPRRIDTGIAFYDHMLDQVAAHGGFSLVLACAGDLAVDAHHSLEDCAIAFGTALSRALGERRGIGRFGFALPMDETEAQVLIDLSGRPYSVFEGSFAASHIGAYPTEMTRHIFRSLADSLGAAIHVRVTGENDHHKTEACFKAFGRALRQALRREGAADALPSTKGVL